MLFLANMLSSSYRKLLKFPWDGTDYPLAASFLAFQLHMLTLSHSRWVPCDRHQIDAVAISLAVLGIVDMHMQIPTCLQVIFHQCQSCGTNPYSLKIRSIRAHAHSSNNPKSTNDLCIVYMCLIELSASLNVRQLASAPGPSALNAPPTSTFHCTQSQIDQGTRMSKIFKRFKLFFANGNQRPTVCQNICAVFYLAG